ncbi:MAG: DUF1905 domain-containing protein, partial [Sphingobacteriales bacterium]
MAAPLVDKEYLLERFPGKGGWTYVSLPEIQKDKEAAFGIVRVSGTIDGVAVKQYSLMPYNNGSLLMAVKAEIRKQIGKEEGDYVHVTLYRDESEYEIPEELKTRFTDAGVYTLFTTYKKWEQKMCAQWIFSAKRTETVNERIIKTIFKLKHKERIY